jgi:hypothetical protein
MNHIDGLFSKIKSAFASSENKKTVIMASCELRANVKLDPSQIEIQGQTLRLNISPGARSMIFQNKGKILEDLKEQIKPVITNIR